jgi:hypothetical protein
MLRAVYCLKHPQFLAVGNFQYLIKTYTSCCSTCVTETIILTLNA